MFFTYLTVLAVFFLRISLFLRLIVYFALERGGYMSKLILLRHGQSVWNKLNIFTGWVDVPLSKEGVEEASIAGKSFAKENIDVIYVSCLVRSQMTAFLAMAESDLKKTLYVEHEKSSPFFSWYAEGDLKKNDFIPVRVAWELNERMYGDLQGKNKQQMIEQFGKEQIQLWRRSYDIAPPGGESLAQTAARSIPFFEKNILEDLKKGLDVLICAHGNSLRSIIMDIEKLTKEQVLQLEIGTGVPIIYKYNEGIFRREDL